ncbi:hypothetical protein As57867_010781, partial [Aphanomyces stellatus]
MLHAAVLANDCAGLHAALAASSSDVNGIQTLNVDRTLVAPTVQDLVQRNDDDAIQLECTPLLLAVVLGRKEMVQRLVACEAVDLNWANRAMHTPLLIATTAGTTDIVRALLARSDVDVNVKNKSDWTPLHAAADLGHAEICRLFVARPDVSLNAPCDFNRFSSCTPLHVAAYRGHLDVVEALLSHPTVAVVATNNEKQTPLMLAIRRHQDAVALCLLACRSVVDTINDVDENHRTSLMLAVMANSIALVQALVAIPHLKIDIKENVGLQMSSDQSPSLQAPPPRQSPLMCAASNANADIVKILVRYTSRKEHLVEAYETACELEEPLQAFEMAKIIFDHSVESKLWPSKSFDDLLHTTLRHGHAEMMAYGLDHSDVQWSTDKLLYRACRMGRARIVELLIQRGLDVNTCETNTETPLLVASRKGFLHIVQLILQAPSFNSLNHATDTHKTALMVACLEGKTDVALALLALPDINVTMKSTSGDTAMRASLQKRLFQVVEALIARGAEFDVLFGTDPLLLRVASFLRVETATAMLLRDLPVQVDANGRLGPRDDHTYSWNIFLDSSTPVAATTRLQAVATIVTLAQFDNCRDDLVRDLALAQDKNGRSVLQTTDAATRKYFNDQLFFCGRYEIHDGPPIHVSSTAVVVHAIDHGLFKQLFDHHAVDGSLPKAGFDACALTLGQKSTSRSTKEGIVVSDFDLYDKNKSGTLAEVEFLHYCDQVFGSQLRVAMKFMRNEDEYKREIDMRKGLNSQSVVELLPTAPEKVFQANVHHLKLHGNVHMAQYPHVLVMPLADRSLEDIYLKERPNDNPIRNMLQEIAELLKQLHENNIIHGDLKKLNVLRVQSHMRLIDMDAATVSGQNIGAKFSSGSLPPELFYKLKDEEERTRYVQYWQSISVSNPDLWEKVKPRNNWVVKTFHSSIDAGDSLPYGLIRASPAVDMWSFGVMIYQFYSGVELIPTNRNQDLDENGIERAATWTKDDLSTRIQNKVSNPLARDLIMKLLAIDPNDRISATAMLSHEYFDIKFDPNAAKALHAIDAKLDQISNQVTSGFEQIHERLDQVVELNKTIIETLGETKGDLMRGIFQATEVHVPTSFVLLPFNILDKQDIDEEDAAVLLEQSANFIHKGIAMGASFMKAVKANKTIGTAIKVFSAGEPLYLYLIDEVQGTP